MKKGYIVLLSGLLLFSACHSSYELIGIEGGRVEMTSVYDRMQDEEAVAILVPYKVKVDSIMSPVIGRSEMEMKADRPESLLSNLIANVLREASANYQEEIADIAVLNRGGLRNDLSEGTITYGNIYEILPFENSLCILSMDGKSVLKLFGEIAKVGGEGLSGARLIITAGGSLVDATIGGKKIDNDRIYKVATLDYLSEGNDGLTAFRQAEDKICPDGVTIRQIFIDYIEALTKQGKNVTSRMDGRITVVK